MKLTQEDLNKLIADEVAKLSPSVDMEEVGKVVDEQLKELKKPADNKVEAGEVEPDGKQWKSFGEQLQAMHRAELTHGHDIDPRLIRAPIGKTVSGLSEGVDSEGGFLVAPQYVAGLIKSTYETGVLVKDCRRVPVTGNRVIMNALAETSRANGSRWGGIQAYWSAEADEKTKSKPKFRQIDLKLNKLTGLYYATDEVLQDAKALESVVSQGFAEEFGFKIDDAIINGLGTGEPLGILNSGGVVEVAIETGQGAATLLPENVEKMWNSMPSKNRLKAKWYINQDVESEFPKMAYPVGTAAISAFVPPKDIGSKAPAGTLKGRPIVPIEQAQALGTVGDIIFADLSEYIIIEKGPMESAVSIHVRFINDETVFRFVYRIDGQPIWNAAVTAFKGGTDRSPYVVLGERA